MTENQWDAVSYIDTDSLFIKIGEFLKRNGVDMEKWNLLDIDTQSDFIIQLSNEIMEYVNDGVYEETQLNHYNSNVLKDEFSIKFKQEVICKRILFVVAKKYGYHLINKEGVKKDVIKVTGLEIIRSETPKLFKKALKDILSMILYGKTDNEIRDKILFYKKEMRSAKPEDISINVGVKGLSKYIDKDGKTGKGCPYHVKGVAGYRFLLKQLGLYNKYHDVTEGDKVKLIYVKQNQYKIESVAYYEWPVEFGKAGIFVDYDKMIDKYLINKVEILLKPMNKTELLDNASMVMELFF